MTGPGQRIAGLLQTTQVCGLLLERAQENARDKARGLDRASGVLADAETDCERVREGWQDTMARRSFDPVLARAWSNEMGASGVRHQAAQDRCDDAQAEHQTALRLWREALARKDVAEHLLAKTRADDARRQEERALSTAGELHALRTLR